MSSLNNINGLAAKLNNYCVIEINGVDSQTFLQGQLTCDVVNMSANSSTLAAHCDPKGKVISLFRLIKFSAEQFWFVFDNSLLPLALQQLKKYAVFSKVTFVEKNLHIAAFSEDCLPNDLITDAEVTTTVDKILVRVNAENDFYLLFSESEQAQAEQAEQWKWLNIVNGEPLFTAVAQGEFIPQALNLQHLEQAISFTKGCYIGQETIARAKYRGANKLAMFTLVADEIEAVEIGSSVQMALENGWRKTGTIINFAHYQQQTWLQVVLNKDVPPETPFRLAEDGAVYQLLENRFEEQ